MIKPKIYWIYLLMITMPAFLRSQEKSLSSVGNQDAGNTLSIINVLAFTPINNPSPINQQEDDIAEDEKEKLL